MSAPTVLRAAWGCYHVAAGHAATAHLASVRAQRAAWAAWREWHAMFAAGAERDVVARAGERYRSAWNAWDAAMRDMRAADGAASAAERQLARVARAIARDGGGL